MMPVIFEFEVNKEFHFAEEFGKHFNMPVTDNRIELPATLGKGYICEVYPGNGLSLCIHHYVLKQDLVLKRMESPAAEMLTIKFDYRRAPVEAETPTSFLFGAGKGSGVELGTGNFFTELSIPAGQAIDFLVVVTSRESLLNLLKIEGDTFAVKNAIAHSQSFVLHEEITAEMVYILQKLAMIDDNTPLAGLLYQTKTQELIYLLFSRLLARDAGLPSVVNQADARKIYEVREAILADLGRVPRLPELAAAVGLSLTKMKQLFRQIFGESIYNYYQAARMNEAAQLLASLSVSETGYKVGFTNLSHFTRLFDKYHQIKPKRFKDRLAGKTVL